MADRIVRGSRSKPAADDRARVPGDEDRQRADDILSAWAHAKSGGKTVRDALADTLAAERSRANAALVRELEALADTRNPHVDYFLAIRAVIEAHR